MADARAGVRHLLDAHLWSGEAPRVRLLGFDVTMRTTDATVARYLADLYAPLVAPDPGGDAAHVLSLASIGEGQRRDHWVVHLDGTRLISTPAPSIAFNHLLWEANRQAVDHTHDRVLVHASAAVFGGRAIVLPGPMGAGKSTLVAALVRAGLGYLTDEVVAIDPASGLVQPYPKYVSLGDALRDLVPLPPPELRPFLGDLRLVPAATLGPAPIPAPAPPRLVVAPRYERGATTRLEPLRPAEALSTLVEHAFHLDRDAPRTLDVLAAVVDRSACFRLVSGDVDHACAALLGLLEDAKASVGS